MTLTLEPIGYIATPYIDRYRAPRQPEQGGLRSEAVVTLEPGRNYEQALEDLAGFERIWLIFWFHRNTTWKPKVSPPRGNSRRGVFATRSPHRPNPIGLSLVRLLEVRGRTLRVADCDLLDGTPILDIKPYIPYVDAFPDAAAGWLAEIEEPRFHIVLAEEARPRLEWLEEEFDVNLYDVAERVLSADPRPHSYRRVREVEGGRFELAIQSWRIVFTVEGDRVLLTDVTSGYTREALETAEPGTLHDEEAHRAFHTRWPEAGAGR